MPRYVILEHDHPERHWDFMLEAGAKLRTWRLTAPPAAGQSVTASASFDHRLVYLDYEGPLSGQRGQVVQWDRGDYEEVPTGDQQVQVYLRGRKLHGIVTLLAEGTLLYCPQAVD
jgi:hypothetical protein